MKQIENIFTPINNQSEFAAYLLILSFYNLNLDNYVNSLNLKFPIVAYCFETRIDVYQKFNFSKEHYSLFEKNKLSLLLYEDVLKM